MSDFGARRLLFGKSMPHDDRQLLQRFLASGSSDDFAPIVDQYLNLVYSTARRVSSIDGGQLEDICQTVFADLARKAGRISEETPLSGWLYRHTCFVASNHNRSERRRRERERQALEMSANESSPDVPNEELHLAMTELPDQDRDALVLRFLDEWDLRRVGERLGISEDAAQKRVSRALDKLRSILGRKGITATTATLAVCLGQQVAASPLVAKSVALAAVGATASTGLIPAVIELMKAPLAKLAAVVVIGGGVAASIHHQNTEIAELRKHNTDLTAKVARLDSLEAENRQLKKTAMTSDEMAALRKKADEVHALRAEMGKLRQQMREATTASVPTPTTSPATEPPADDAAPVKTQFLFAAKIVGRGDEFPDAKVPEIIHSIAGGSGSAAVFPLETTAQVIKAFKDAPGFDILSAPTMISVEGQQAQIQVGQAQPIVTGFHTQADGTRFNETKTNIHTGVTIDLMGTKQANDSALVNMNFTLTTFDGYLDEGRGINKKAVSPDVWYHETAPIVDIANTQVAVLVGPKQTMLLHSRSKPGNKDYWIFLTPTLLDKSTVKSINAQAKLSPPVAAGTESKVRAAPPALRN